MWRIGLRDRALLEPPGGRWKDIDPGVIGAIDAAWEALPREWDAKYPENPISSGEDEGDDEGRPEYHAEDRPPRPAEGASPGLIAVARLRLSRSPRGRAAR